MRSLRLTSKHVTAPPDSQKNFLVVDNKTDNQTIESTFDNFTQERKDIAIVLINQHVRDRVPEPCSLLLEFVVGKTNKHLKIAERIRHRVDTYTAAFPSLLEIPSKDHPYDPEKDSVLKRVRRLFGE